MLYPRKNRWRLNGAFLISLLPDGYAMLMRPNKVETTVHGCHCPGDMAVHMPEVLVRPLVGV